MPRAEAQAAEPLCGGSPSTAAQEPGVFGRRHTQDARAEFALFLREGARGRQKARLSSSLQGARWPPQEQVWRGSMLPAWRGVWRALAHRGATEMCFHNHLIFSCQM